jgi:hypothetical protein
MKYVGTDEMILSKWKETWFHYTLLSTNCRALGCVSLATYWFLLLRISVFMNTIFRELHSNYGSFTTHHIFMRT